MSHRDEDVIDIIDLIGVVVKRRKFIIKLTLVLTLLAVVLFCAREYLNSRGVERNFSPDNALFVQRDPLLATYLFFVKPPDNSGVYKNFESNSMKPSPDLLSGYKKFLGLLLYPSLMDMPDFEVRKLDVLSVDYLFLNAKDQADFTDKYNSFVGLFMKLGNSISKMDESLYSSCKQFFGMTRTDPDKKWSNFFYNAEQVRTCNTYNYYLSLVGNKIAYAVVAPSEAYIFFICDFVKTPNEVLVKPFDGSKNSKEIKLKSKNSYNIRKIVKYSFLSFVLATMFSVFMAFVADFWKRNKAKLKFYWKE
ncbi:MAG: hypothetical protein V1647_01415 [Pseudomonadota bacterium]